MSSAATAAWDDALQGIRLFAVAQCALGGIVLRAAAGPVREQWLAHLKDALATDVPIRRVPLNVTDSRLLGGLDLAGTLQAGRPVLERGLMADADGGVLVLAMAERISVEAAARFTNVLDAHEVNLERDGMTSRYSTDVAVVALDEGCSDDERPPVGLVDRLAIHCDLTVVSARDAAVLWPSSDDLAQARARFASVTIDTVAIEALCATAMALGIASLRPAMLACVVARAAAALAGRDAVIEQDAVLAGRLVLAPRATCLPPSSDDTATDSAATPEQAPAPESTDASGAEPSSDAVQAEPDDVDDATAGASPEDVVLDATRAAIPAHLLARLALVAASQAGVGGGKSGALQKSSARGRSTGVRRGALHGSARLHVLETLRAAAPWQRLRLMQRTAAHAAPRAARIDVRHEDFQIKRYVQRAQTTTIFVVDASGSAALHRLAETKGAVEMLLAQCYARRDRVAVLSFRHRAAELLLAPTRSLVRAKRSLAGLPAGGGTPLAAAMDAAADLSEGLKRRGDTPILVFLSDGRANVARDGTPGRERAQQEAMQAATRLKLGRVTSLFIDTSRHPAQAANELALQMGANYLALPNADSAALCAAVRQAAQ